MDRVVDGRAVVEGTGCVKGGPRSLKERQAIVRLGS